MPQREQDVRAIRVECYSGYRADERPLRFYLGEKLFGVVDVDDSWYSPGTRWFRVRANDGNVYVLCHNEGQDTWMLDAYRAARGEGHSGENSKGV